MDSCPDQLAQRPLRKKDITNRSLDPCFPSSPNLVFVRRREAVAGHRRGGALSRKGFE